MIHRVDRWSIVQSPRPLDNTRHHYVLVPDEHVDDILDLDAVALNAYWGAMKWLRGYLGLTFWCLGVRCGENDHLTVHVVVGDVDDPNHEKVRFPLTGPKESLHS